MRSRPRLDTTQNPIRETLHAFGWKTRSLAALGDGLPDLLAMSARGNVYLIECKTGDAPMTEAQRDLINEAWPVLILRSPAEAEALARQERAL